MTRRLLNLLTALSLMLCVAIVALWVRSFWVSDWIGRVHYSPEVPTEDHHVYLRSASGVAELVGGGDPADNFSHVRLVWEQSTPVRYPLTRDEPALLRALGIGWAGEHRLSSGETRWGAYLHFAWPASLSGLTAGVLILRRRVAAWRGQGRCLRCGYDLTGNVSGVCPECGMKATA